MFYFNKYRKNNYYDNIKNYLVNNETIKLVKDYSKNRSDLIAYYNIGKGYTSTRLKYYLYVKEIINL